MDSNGLVTNADMGHLGARRTCSVSTSRADDYTVKSNGGFEFVGDTEKDLFNKTGAEPRAKLFKQGEETVPIVEVSDITMPPWSINLVGFGDEYRCDHVDIPRGVTYSYVSLSPHVKAVSADTASTLLRQIAALTSIATEQSLKARDEILHLKRDSELALKTKEAEAAVLKRELDECRQELELVKSADNIVTEPSKRLAGILKSRLRITAIGVNLQREVLIFNFYAHWAGGKLALPQTKIWNLIQVSVSGDNDLQTDNITNNERLASEQRYGVWCGVVSVEGWPAGPSRN